MRRVIRLHALRLAECEMLGRATEAHRLSIERLPRQVAVTLVMRTLLLRLIAIWRSNLPSARISWRSRDTGLAELDSAGLLRATEE